jgi:hypothetical protein
MTNQLGERMHERTWEMLPWYVNGTLTTAEEKMVESHLASCPRCQNELDDCSAMNAALREAEEQVPSPHPVQLTRLLEKIDALPEPEQLPAIATSSAWFRSSTTLRWVAAAQLLLLLGLGALFLHQPAATGARFVTLSQRSENPRGPEVRMVFADSATAGQVRDLLLRVGGHMTEGPSEVGAYTVQIAGGAHKDPLDLVLAYLRAQPIVRFAQPVAGTRDSSEDGKRPQ